MSTLKQAREAMAQVIHDSFWAMQAGEWPDPAVREPFNAGDMQLASDLQEAGYAHVGPVTDADMEAALNAGAASMSKLTGVAPWEQDDDDRVAMRAALEAARGVTHD